MKCDHSHIQRHCRACALPAVGAAVSLNGQISCAAACSLRVRFCSRRELRVAFSRVYLAARFSFLVLLVTFTPARIGLSLQALVFLFSNLTSFSTCSHELSTVHQNFANLLAAFTSKQAVGVRSSLPDFPLKTIVNLIYWSWLSPLGVMLSKGQGEIILHLTLIFYLIQFLPSN